MIPIRATSLFDGKRLWLIDWETWHRNDPLVDVAILIDNLARRPIWRVYCSGRVWVGSQMTGMASD